MVFARSRTADGGQADGWNVAFLVRVATLVATAIDNLRHQHDAVAREQVLEAERDH
jgi:hypothetical protein